MPYTDHFRLADDLVAHLDLMLPNITDPFLMSRYIGMVAVAGVTSYEMAVREIFCDFADAKHLILGNFTRTYFERLNGKVKYRHLHEEYARRFGEKYQSRIKKRMRDTERQFLQTQKRSVLSSYGNLITWRHLFVHQGVLPTNATYKEAVESYELGKQVIHCLAGCMKR
jgi:RiboL-PSP-HEPN